MSTLRVWPRETLKNLPALRSLSIHPTHPMKILPNLKPTGVDLNNLSRYLVDLELDYCEAINDTMLKTLPTGLQRLWLPQNKSISDEGLRLLPSSLHSLGLHRNQLVKTAAKFPPNLTCFYGSPISLLPPETIFSELPKSMKTLNLTFHEKFEVTNTNWRVWDLFNSGSSSLTSIAAHTGCGPRDPHPTKPSRLPPKDLSTLALPEHLETLEIVGNYCTVPSEYLQFLPKSLTKLKMRPLTHAWLNWNDVDVSRLPIGLKSLVFWPWVESPPSEVMNQAFNVRIQNIQVGKFRTRSPRDGEALTPESFAVLPPTLTTYRWCRYSLDSNQQPFNPGIMSASPGKTGEWSEADLNVVTRQLPQTLRSLFVYLALGINLNWEDFPLGIEKFNGVMNQAQLPSLKTWSQKDFDQSQSLVALDGAKSRAKGLGMRPIRKLSSCTMPKHSRVSDAEVCSFDYKKSMSAANFGHLTRSGFLGPETRTLKFRDSPAIAPLSELFKTLKWLTHLEFCVDKENVDSFNDASIGNLPRGLTYLKITESYLTDNCLPYLPAPHLRTLLLPNNGNITGKAHPIPHTLTKLSLGLLRVDCPIRLPPRLIYYSTRKEFHSFEEISCLPRNLTHLQLTAGHFQSPISTDFFSVLPPSLTELFVSNFKSVSEEDIIALPRSLLSLDIRFFNQYHFTPNTVTLFPPRLTNLSLGQAHWTTDEISKLPSTLTILCIMTDLSQTVVPHESFLPARVSFASISHNHWRRPVTDTCPFEDESGPQNG